MSAPDPEPDRHTTPRRPIGVDDNLWDPLGEYVGERNRSATVRKLLAWWMRVPGAQLPRRPAEWPGKTPPPRTPIE